MIFSRSVQEGLSWLGTRRLLGKCWSKPHSQGLEVNSFFGLKIGVKIQEDYQWLRENLISSATITCFHPIKKSISTLKEIHFRRIESFVGWGVTLAQSTNQTPRKVQWRRTCSRGLPGKDDNYGDFFWKKTNNDIDGNINGNNNADDIKSWHTMKIMFMLKFTWTASMPE